MTDLESVLGATPPPEFDRLSPEERAHLADALKAAADRRAMLINRSVDASLQHLPRLLRGTVRRALGM